MKHTLSLLTAAAVLGWGAACLASGVGLAQYNPQVVVPVSHECSTGACAPAGGCLGCGPHGFPANDGATPPPCSADGACYPNKPTFGFYHTNWRRWPGDVDVVAPTPADAVADDGLLEAFDTPKPEEEDKQAPPPIDEDFGAGGEEGSDDLPPLEIDLPPLPERPPLLPPREAPPVEEPAGGLPFGAAPTDSPAVARVAALPRVAEPEPLAQQIVTDIPPETTPDAPVEGPAIGWRPRPAEPTPGDDRGLPPLPDFSAPPSGDRGAPANLRPRHEVPPALPRGFTSVDRAGQARFDAQVRPTAAVMPAGR